MRLNERVEREVARLIASGCRRDRLAIYLPRDLAREFPEHWLGMPVIGRDDMPPDTIYIADPDYFAGLGGR